MRRWLLSAACGAALGLLGLPSAALADTTLTVTGTTDSTSGTCTATTCTTLRAALDASTDDTTGTVTINLGAGATYSVTQGAIDPTVPDDCPAEVVLDGNGATIDLAGNGDHDFFEPSCPVEIDNLTIEDADAPDSTAIDPYRAISISLNNVTFSHDSEVEEVYGGEGLSLTDVTFDSDSDHDAVDVTGGSQNVLTRVTFSDQTGQSLYVDAPTTLDAVAVDGGDSGPHDVLQATAPVQIGGMSVTGVTAPEYSPIYFDAPSGSSSTVDDLSVTGNQVGAPPVSVQAGTVMGQNWTVGDNTRTGASTLPGGGVMADGGTLDLTFATLAGNSDAGDADELYATDDSTLDVGDSIVAGSSAGGAVQCVADAGSHIVSTGYNLDQAGGCGFSATGDLNGVNPLLGPVATGPDPAFTAVSLTYAPLEYASPAVGVIPPTACSASTDELGDARPQDPNGCDIGAYEPPATAFTLTQSGAPSTATAGTSVTYTLAATNASGARPQHTVITDTLPTGATLSSASVSVAGGAPVACTGTTTLTCPVGALPRGEQAVATVTATLNTVGPNVDTANISSEYPDVDDAKGTLSASTQVSAPATPPASTGPTTSTSTSTTLKLSGLKLTPARFAARGKATLTFTATVAGSLTATVTRSELGVKSGKSCVAPPKHATAKLRRCTRTVTVARFTVAVKAGANTLTLPAKVRDLAPGAYHLTVGTTTLAFTVTQPAPARHRHRSTLVERRNESIDESQVG